MEMRVKRGKPGRSWDKFDEEAERQGAAMRFANDARANPSGKGKKVGKGQFRN